MSELSDAVKKQRARAQAIAEGARKGMTQKPKKSKPKKKESALEKELRLKKEKRAREQAAWDAAQKAKRNK